tara:strand:+ start:263 stop:910 length:648 start_codon:yes stop_codon:yes gene_type:complete
MAGELAFTAAANAGSAAFVGPPDSSIHTKLKLPADTGAAGKMLAVKSANHSSTNAELEWATVSGGLSEADQWRLTTTFSSADSYITTNWERVDDRGSAGPLGTGMSESSGVFTFPSTGYWLVTFYAVCAGTHCDWVNCLIDATLNNSAYNNVAMGRDSCKDADSYSDVSAQALMDVTSTTNVKMKFQVKAHNALDWYGSTQVSETNVVFLKLGAT